MNQFTTRILKQRLSALYAQKNRSQEFEAAVRKQLEETVSGQAEIVADIRQLEEDLGPAACEEVRAEIEAHRQQQTVTTGIIAASPLFGKNAEQLP